MQALKSKLLLDFSALKFLEKFICKALLVFSKYKSREFIFLYGAYVELVYKLMGKSQVSFALQAYPLIKNKLSFDDPKFTGKILDNLLYIDPILVKWGGKPSGAYREGYFIAQGDWDLVLKESIESYMNSHIYCKAIIHIFLEKRPYSECEQYREMLNLVQNGKTDDWRAKKCTTEADVDMYFLKLSNIFEKIKHEGYKTQVQMGEKDHYDEIAIYIDRSGELQKQQGSGHHRFAMSQILGIKSIPVVVKSIHYQWAEKCFFSYGGNLVDSINQGLRDI